MSDQSPRVTVGLPVYNGEPYLEAALDSLIGQTFDDFELIVCDDGSTDRTLEIAREYERLDARVRVERWEPNRGASPNFNRCVTLANAPYFRWASHDDVCYPSHLERCVDLLDEEPASTVLVFTGSETIDAEGEVINSQMETFGQPDPRPWVRLAALFAGLERADPLFGLMRTTALRQTRLLRGFEAADYVLFTELALLGSFRSTPDVLFQRRVHPGMSTQAHLTPAERAAWFDRSNRGRWRLPRTRLFYEHLRAITGALLSPAERARCYAAFARHWLPRNARGLAKDYVGLAVPSFARYDRR